MGREGFQVSSMSKSRFQAYGYNNEKDKDDVYDTPIARRSLFCSISASQDSIEAMVMDHQHVEIFLIAVMKMRILIRHYTLRLPLHQVDG